ncbi:MAG: hypothetical protein KKD28_00820, partial [Chloroflexi bacterium]|nr:hypothetical protein [Chloroflexota bacterium]
MKKLVVIVSGVLIACILLAGMFSAGILIGNRFTSNTSQGSDTSQPIVELPFTSNLDEPDTDVSELDLPEAPPTSESIPDVPPPPDDLEDMFAPFWEAWDIVHEQYVDQPVDDEAMMEGAIQGMLESINDTVSITTAQIPGTDEYISQSGTPDEMQELFTPFWENWALAHAPDDQALMQGAISGMLDSLG